MSHLSSDIELKHPIMTSGCDVQIRAHGGYSCWIISTSPAIAPSGELWSCYQSIAQHLLAEWSPDNDLGKLSFLEKILRNLYRIFVRESPLELAKKYIQQGKPERAIIVLRAAAAEHQIDQEGYRLLKELEENIHTDDAITAN